MAKTETVVHREEWDVDRRLAEMELERTKLLRIRDRAFAAAADANPFFPANAAGTFSYHHGTFGLRDEFVGENWVMDRAGGVEMILNTRMGLRIAFANVDVSCNDDHHPKPRSDKGSGSERVSNGELFKELPHYAGDTSSSLYYLMMDQNGAAELSLPVVEGRTFKACKERIYLSDGGDLSIAGLDLGSDDDAADDFDPQVARK